MGSMMKELVAVKPNETWDIILDVTLSEGKNLRDETEVIRILKENYPDLSNLNFVVEGVDMFALSANMKAVNPGDECKI